MQRTCCLVLLLGTAGVSLLLGCGQQPPPSNDSGPTSTAQGPPTPTAKTPGAANTGQPGQDPGTTPGGQKQGDPVGGGDPPLKWQPVDFTPPDPNQQKYDAAVFEALNLLADKKYPDALTSLQVAATYRNTEFVQNEIKKLHDRIDQIKAADQAAEDIKAVLDQGQAVDAAKLATIALQEFGASDSAPKLIQIQQQADALLANDLGDNAAKFKLFADQGQTALDAGNLRAAVVAFEQALAYGDGAKVKEPYDALRARLAKYDGNRQQAFELRKDPANLEAAIDLLKDAASAWDTPQIRQDLDAYALALQQRRDRLAIAAFQVHGEVGIPDAGQVVAEELLPYFKGRFDLLERAQVARLFDELKLDPAGFNNNPQDQQALGKVAKARFLVLGSLTRLGGITVHARLVDAGTGLIVQTAKISAATPDELLQLLPELAKMLQMSDEDRAAYEQNLVSKAKPVLPVDTTQPLPPPPPDPVAGAQADPPPPIDLGGTPPPPDQGGDKADGLDKLQPPPGNLQPQPLPPGGADEDAIKKKMLYNAVLLGDNAFFNGNYPLAMQYFVFAQTLDPDTLDIRVRIARCQALMPPPAVVILPPARPRLAIINFFVAGNPKKVPHWLGWWTPQNLAPYLSSSFEIADPGQVNWWMARMGLTRKDLMYNPYARLWLGRALNVRYFVLGNVVETASFDVNTYLINAETGYLEGRGWIHAHHPEELRFRLDELAQSTLTAPGQLQMQKKQHEKYEQLIVQAQIHTKRGEFTLALGFFKQARQQQPNSIEVRLYEDRCRQIEQQRAWEEARHKQFEKEQREARERQLRQQALAQQAEQQRLLALQAVAALNDAQRQQWEAKRQAQKWAAHEQLLKQARVQFQQNNFQVSVQNYQSALSMKQDDATYRELAAAKAKLDQVTRERDAQAAQLKATQYQLQKEKEINQLAVQLAIERKQQDAAAAAARKAKEATERSQAQVLIDQGKQQMASAKYSAAIGSFQAAQRIHKDDATADLLSLAMVAQAKASADAKGAAAREALERQLAQEKLLRQKAENEAKANQEKYQLALQIADKALASREYDAALLKYQEAGKVFKTDAVLTGINKAQAAREQAKAAAAQAKQKQLESEQLQGNFKKIMADGQAALAGQQYAVAIDKFGQARKLLPDNVDAIAALSKAEHERDLIAAATAKKTQDAERLKTFNHLLDDGKANLAKKQYDAAIANLTEALKLNPGHVEATQVLQAAQKARQDAGTSADQKLKAAAYQKALQDGRTALQNKQYDAAIKAFQQAQMQLPGDKTAGDLLLGAQKARDDSALAAKQKAADLQRAADVKKALDDGRAALAGKNLKAATDALTQAAKLLPNDPGVLQFQKDLQKAQSLAAAQADADAKRKMQYDGLMAAGKKALNDKRYDDAVKSLYNATVLMPGDKTSNDLLRLAQQQQKDASDTAAKKAGYDLALKQGQDLYGMKKYDEAIKAFQAAASYMPGDATAAAWQKQAEKARLDAAGDAADKAKKKASYDLALKQGQDWLAMKKYDEAVKAFQLAGTYLPGDPTAAALLKQTQKAQTDAAAAQLEAQKKAQFNQLMKDGQAALGAKKYADAVKLFTDASKLMPADASAAAAVKEANREWEASKVPVGPSPAQKAEYDRQMKAGAAADKLNKYAEAIKAYEAALKQLPKDSKATYSLYMAQGNQHMGLKQYPSAVSEFEAALRLYPGDAEATAALKKAKNAK